MCTWADWIDDLRARNTLADRAIWWRNRCVRAMTTADAVNVQINQQGAFTVPGPLQAWAQLPPWLSATQPVTRPPRRPRRSRTP
ncbi:hypothetical protein [Kibdelosporangium aridum]|uniref:Uncharacterized protein n=1 Tax=Kibdelosporangium aridum TaxID=2030 RepID=A0A1W2G150_KIBAR|nr:hypothetical protein [Kibdelosporangium aridum]SMD27628.1 hypothetical protein SAMN05661093_11238 [Kibdelosporangium aridum]